MQNLWKAFDDGPIDNDEKVASSKEYSQFKARGQKPCMSYLWPNMTTIDKNTLYDENGCKPTPFGAAHTYVVHIRDQSDDEETAHDLVLNCTVL